MKTGSDYGSYFPVALRTDGRKVVIVGGDDEAAIKADKLHRAGARITVISEDAVPAIERCADAGTVELIRRSYADGDLEGAFVAIVCDVSKAEMVRQEAARRNVLLNVLDRTELCDFSAVAYVDRGGLQIAVHSSGKSAALARRIRERLEAEFDERYAELVAALGELRPIVKRTIPGSEERRRFWLGLVNRRLLDELDAGTFSRSNFSSRVKRLAAAAGGR